VFSVFQRIPLSVTLQVKSVSRALRSEQCLSGREVTCVLTRLARDCVDNAVGSGENFIVNRYIQGKHNFVGSPRIGGAHTSTVESSVRNEHSMRLNRCGVCTKLATNVTLQANVTSQWPPLSQDHSTAGRIRSTEKSNDIGNRTRDLPACSVMFQLITLPRDGN
jgi:hypothetical protein